MTKDTGCKRKGSKRTWEIARIVGKMVMVGVQSLRRDLCTRKKPEEVSEVSEKTTVTENPGQSNKTEMTKTSENVMEILQYNKRLM